MKPTLSFYVMGDPKGQPRPRAFARKFGNKWSARVYDAKTAEGWKGLIAAECKANLPSGFTAYEGPVALRLGFKIARPKSHFKSQSAPARAARAPLLPKSGMPSWCEKKPDADNYAKAVMDCFTQLGIWRDDSQVCDLHIFKEYAIGNSQGGVAITINELAP